MRAGRGVGVAERPGIGHQAHVERRRRGRFYRPRGLYQDVIDELGGSGGVRVDQFQVALDASRSDAVVVDHHRPLRRVEGLELAQPIGLRRIDHQLEVGFPQRSASCLVRSQRLVAGGQQKAEAPGQRSGGQQVHVFSQGAEMVSESAGRAPAVAVASHVSGDRQRPGLLQALRDLPRRRQPVRRRGGAGRLRRVGLAAAHLSTGLRRRCSLSRRWTSRFSIQGSRAK